MNDVFGLAFLCSVAILAYMATPAKPNHIPITCGGWGIRTPDILLAKQALWPAELNPPGPQYKKFPLHPSKDCELIAGPLHISCQIWDKTKKIVAKVYAFSKKVRLMIMRDETLRIFKI